MITAQAWWSLFLMGSIYMIGELGHFLLGAVSRAMAQDIHFGDKGCLKNSSSLYSHFDSKTCTDEESQAACLDVIAPEGPSPCAWDYTGLGLEYHVLAGPAFVAVFTVAGLLWGYFADKFNRVHFLFAATLIFSTCIVGTSFATQYWHVLLFRMGLGLGESGCSPLASGMIADTFPKSQRGLAMSLFNWGIYIGYGLSYTVGNYVTEANLFDKGWRPSYVVSGIPGLFLALILLFTATEPRTGSEQGHELKETDAELNDNESPPGNGIVAHPSDFSSKGEIVSESTRLTSFLQILKVGWDILKNRAMILLLLGACVRHSAGFCWGYNSALYFKTYYPDYDASLFLTGISIGAGASGTLLGGYLSDRLVSRMGISARALVLAGSQLLASPFAFAVFFLEPPYALLSLMVGYTAAEMWFGVMFAILVELVPSDIRSKAVAVVLFCMNNVGGNTPVIVDPIANLTSYRTAIIILYPGALLTSSILFFLCWAMLRRQGRM